MRYRQSALQRACLLLPLLGVFGCNLPRLGRTTPPLAPDLDSAAPADSIKLISVHQPPGSLRPGHPTDLIIRIQYTLSSVDRAELVVRLDQFPDRYSCTGSDGVTLLEKNMPMSLGSHVVELLVTWPGDTGAGSNGRAFGTGAISISASMGTEKPKYEFLTRKFGTQYCMQF